MNYKGTQIGPDGKRRPTGEPDLFVSGVELPVVVDAGFTPPQFLEFTPQTPEPTPVEAEPEVEPEVESGDGISAPDYSDYGDDGDDGS